MSVAVIREDCSQANMGADQLQIPALWIDPPFAKLIRGRMDC